METTLERVGRNRREAAGPELLASKVLRPTFMVRSPVLALAALLATLLGGSDALASPRLESQIDSFYRSWLHRAEFLLDPRERAEFLALPSDTAREERMRALWLRLGPDAWRRFSENAEVEREWQLRAEDQRRALLVAGKPTEIEVFEACDDFLRRVVLWRYDGWSLNRQTARAAADEAWLLFVQRSNFDPRSFRAWSANAAGGLLRFDEEEGGGDLGQLLSEAESRGCLSHDERSHLRRALDTAIDLEGLQAIVPWEPASSHLPALAASSFERGALAAAGASTQLEAARLAVRYPGLHGGRVVLQADVRLPVGLLARLPDGTLFDRVEVLGDLYRRGRRVDSFRATHHIAGRAASDHVTLSIYRRVDPGAHVLRLRVADPGEVAYLRTDRHLTVPDDLTARAPEPAGSRQGLLELTRDEVIALHTLPSVELVPAEGFGPGRPVEVEALVRGGPIAAVEIEAEGAAPVILERQPFRLSVEMPTPARALVARALDAAGRVLAEDREVVRRDARPLRVRLEGAATDDLLRVVVQVPEGERLARVECHHNRRLVATLEAPPFVCPAPRGGAGLGLGGAGNLQYARAVAVLERGDTAEAIRVLSPDPADEVDVRLVELFVSVLDGSRRPVTDLAASELRVRSLDPAGLQTVVRADTVETLPLDVALLMDTSSSLGRTVRVAAASAARFFEEMLRPGDRASLLTFDHDLRRRAPLTGEVRALSYAASGLRARGATRLWDAVAYALQSLSGAGARRALLVLSDGADTGSDFAFEEATQASIRAGVLVFPIVLGSRVDEATQEQLESLADRTGGVPFRASSVDQLASVYREIARLLRHQYLVVVRPASERAMEPGNFVVEVARPGLMVRGAPAEAQEGSR